MRLPDFLIGGAPRAGTTWLYALLDRHPDVYMAKPVIPEPKFFLVDDLYEKGLQFYSTTWFAAAGAGQVAGEKSTDYLESADAAQRIARDLPSVRLVFILREPVDRAYSNYLWTRMNGIETEDFATAIALEDEREKTLPAKWRFARPFAYFSRGLYAELLETYMRRIPRDRILVLRYEDIIDAPEVLATRLHHFLGIAERSGDSRGLGVLNPSEKIEDPPPAEVTRLLAERYEAPNRRLASLLGSEFTMWDRPR